MHRQPSVLERRGAGPAFGEKRVPPRVRGRPLSRSAGRLRHPSRAPSASMRGRPVPASPIAQEQASARADSGRSALRVCIGIRAILHAALGDPLSARSAFRTNARTPASTAGCSTGRTPASRRRPPRRAAPPRLCCRPNASARVRSAECAAWDHRQAPRRPARRRCFRVLRSR